MLRRMDIDRLALDALLSDVRKACTHGTDRACICKFYVADAIQEKLEVPYNYATDLAAALWDNQPIPEELPIRLIDDYPHTEDD